MMDLLLLATGLILLLGGGDLLVRGAAGLAKIAGLSPMVIGLTIVAFGTSAPELSVNILAAVHGNGTLAFGNIVGSNIANVALVLGLAAMIKPLRIQGTIITREIPMMLLASGAALIMSFDGFLRGAVDMYDRSDGLLFLLLFSVFLYYTISEVLHKRTADPFVEQARMLGPESNIQSWLINGGLLLAGLAALMSGGRLTVDAAVHLAEAMGIPKVVIGLTIIAVGTSLPELVTSIMATWRGQTDLAVGNVVGSNIFNLLFVTGLSATIAPITIPAGGVNDLLVMTALSLILLPMAITDTRRIVRSEGLLLLTAYAAYVLWRADILTR